MNLQNIKKVKNEKGFTIVELLIVIVVIGILAAIVIVAYQGVTQRANDGNDKSNAVSIAKVAEAVNVDPNISTGYPFGATSAALTTAFNAGSTSNLPTGVNIKYVASTGSAPTLLVATEDAKTRTYSVKVCTAASPNNTGLMIYYPDRTNSAVRSQSVGTGC